MDKNTKKKSPEIKNPTELNEIANESKKNMFYGIEFPHYFQSPRWVQTADMSFTVAVDSTKFTAEMQSNWQKRYIFELAALSKLVLEKLIKEKIKSL